MASLADLVGKPEGKLSIVGTPIGNLSDASPRVISTLDTSDLVFCEDTRVTMKLMRAFHITAKLERCDENVIDSKTDMVLDMLDQGLHLSFVSDAGMPGVSDPGQVLVDAALDAGHKVEIIPGPSAVACALAASGFNMEHFYFEGFLPRKKGAQKQRLEVLSKIPGAIVIYESPYRVAQTLATIAEVLDTRQVALVRELTKIHEEVVRGQASQVAQAIGRREVVKGECVIVISAPSALELKETQERLETSATEALSLEEAIEQGLGQGRPKSALARSLAREYNLERSAVYDKIQQIARG